ncbi:phosphoglycerate kinase [Finegoldia magna]|uniref:Phosphoglycerate kinase n=1 Tax=Finegoldia magna (strain ATCC 29328 / DSM 20472 / WAL 2508) TaxID=334413 RepID=PGK_FINM2|nr:phosphoglycerate kinase [Finegoldia magna]B0S1H0.1 RecName: Full=Phosphoglycerate kinase [Finegoldia magna ATCC 29328]UEA70428.1 phosphoglycerate kinase [Finegoldia magna]BAG08210.1 phosphoglycerate kinase [Finegoldia magna ATCC 29328]
MNKKTLKDLNVENKRVLVRVDFNVPIKEGIITDTNRIEASLTTIKYLIDNNAKVILMSHLGRPKGEPKPEFSLKPVAQKLSEMIGQDVKFIDSDKVVDDSVIEESKKLQPKEIMLIQNTRFRKEEEKNDQTFSKELSQLADLYVNDAFGTSHRAHASNVGVSKFLPSAVGFLVQKEIEIMGKALENPERPFTAILGGAKVSDKIGVIENLLDKVDTILIGGAMAFTFIKSQGKNVGKSLIEEDKLDLAKSLLEKAQEKGVKIFLPVDFVVAKEMTEESDSKVINIDDFTDDIAGFDIGTKTIKIFDEEIQKSKTIVWNGPMGVFEIEQFSKGTFEIANSLVKSKAITIVGGGDSASAIAKSGNKDKVTHVSTGGGASLEFLEGKVLPGIDCIDER